MGLYVIGLIPLLKQCFFYWDIVDSLIHSGEGHYGKKVFDNTRFLKTSSMEIARWRGHDH